MPEPAIRVGLLVVKNTTGGVLIVAGLAMLLLPGQGLLTLAAGLLLLDFPGKYGVERRLVSRGPVRASLNWIRRRRGREPLTRWNGSHTPTSSLGSPH